MIPFVLRSTHNRLLADYRELQIQHDAALAQLVRAWMEVAATREAALQLQIELTRQAQAARVRPANGGTA